MDSFASIDREAVRELRRIFRQVTELDGVTGKNPGTKVLTGMWRDIAGFVAEKARANTKTPLERKMRGAIKGSGTAARGARLRIAKTKKFDAAWAAFWGQTKRSGWFAHPRYRAYSGRDQGFKPWVGAAWKAGHPGEGPYAINDAIARHRPEIEDYMRAGIQAALDRIDHKGAEG